MPSKPTFLVSGRRDRKFLGRDIVFQGIHDPNLNSRICHFLFRTSLSMGALFWAILG